MSILPNWLTGYDAANADAAAAADAKLRQMNSATYSRGGSAYNYVAATQGTDAADALAGKVANDYAAQAPIGVTDQQAAIDATFTDSLDASAKSIIGTPLGIFWAEVKALIKAVPWWVWAISVVAGFLWLGGAAIIRKFVVKKSA